MLLTESRDCHKSFLKASYRIYPYAVINDIKSPTIDAMTQDKYRKQVYFQPPKRHLRVDYLQFRKKKNHLIYIEKIQRNPPVFLQSIYPAGDAPPPIYQHLLLRRLNIFLFLFLLLLCTFNSLQHI